jgi:hypothetical protein
MGGVEVGRCDVIHGGVRKGSPRVVGRRNGDGELYGV